ncbi:MAG TPA: hypothetical protein PKD90_15980 [Phnomibacter sp.]|mgnify:CR=1 FL=1|nr:hypothetical protein [Phnomibacter sp.]
MNVLKKYLGILWMLMAPALVLFMLWQAWEKIADASPATRANTALQWVIILLVFIPISLGFYLFGRYSWQGEYTHLPESSEEIEVA